MRILNFTGQNVFYEVDRATGSLENYPARAEYLYIRCYMTRGVVGTECRKVFVKLKKSDVEFDWEAFKDHFNIAGDDKVFVDSDVLSELRTMPFYKDNWHHFVMAHYDPRYEGAYWERVYQFFNVNP